MEDTPKQKSKLEIERDGLANSGRLHWFHWAIVILSVLLTLTAWTVLSRQIEERIRSQFDREVTQTVELVTERMRKYEDALWSGVAALQANGGEMTHLQWRTFAQSLDIEHKYPGISGMGVIVPVSLDDLDTHLYIQRRSRPDYKVHPEHAQIEHLPIMYIEPEEANAKAVGLDIAHETNRYTSAIKARETGIANITGPIVLVQDEERTPGFLFYAPYYSIANHDSEQARIRNFKGLVYAPFIVKNLLEGTLDKDKRSVGIRLSDGNQVLYDEHTATDSDFDADPQFTQQIEMNLYGRTWIFDIWSAKSFRQLTTTNQPLFVLAGGLSIDALLLALFLFLSRANRRAISFADRMNVELLQQTEALTRSNADLESFAYVASHDLKTPLRGISDLTTYLEEDLETYLSTPDANPDVKRNFERLRQRTRRMDNLIRGILDYASVDSIDEIGTLDIAAFLLRLQSDPRPTFVQKRTLQKAI